MNNIYLVGFMGAGKSMTGRLLAGKLKRKFLDTDSMIETRCGRPILDIFEENGEPEFRRLERRIVREASRRRNHVVSTGGGAVLGNENRQNMARTGTSVFLSCSFQELWKRLRNKWKRRPLIHRAGKSGIRDMMRSRKAYYQKADITVSTTGKTPAAVVSEIAQRLINPGHPAGHPQISARGGPASGWHQEAAVDGVYRPEPLRGLRLRRRTACSECRIYAGRGIFCSLPLWTRELKRYHKVCLVTNHVLDERFGNIIRKTISKISPDVCVFALPAGEKAKELKWVERLYSFFAKNRMGRDSVVIALGGGSVIDTAGFAAATYMRGIEWITIPTTLLGQVDSGIGGKVGVNHGDRKNMVGAFYQPVCVICDTQFLSRLPGREIVSGLGEVLKYGLVFEPGFFSFARRNWQKLLSLDQETLVFTVKRCARWKAGVVSRDERDELHIREKLNFGHTLGHALESVTLYRTFRHGEALIWGMRAAVALSVIKNHLDPGQAKDADLFLSRIPVPPVPRGLDIKKLWSAIQHDKKCEMGQVRFVLLSSIGRTITESRVSREDLKQAFELIGL